MKMYCSMSWSSEYFRRISAAYSSRFFLGWVKKILKGSLWNRYYIIYNYLTRWWFKKQLYVRCIAIFKTV